MALYHRTTTQSKTNTKNSQNTNSDNLSKQGSKPLRDPSVKTKENVKTSSKTKNLKETNLKNIETLLLEIKLEIKDVEIKFTEKMAENHSSILRWMILLFSGSLIATIGMFVAIFMQILSFHT